MFIECNIVPLKNATGEQLQALGLALGRWSRREMGMGGMARSVDQRALDDLMRGELPQPMANRLSDMFVRPGARSARDSESTLDQVRNVFPQLPGEQMVRIKLCRNPSCNRALAIQSLVQDVPADLVEDIRIDGISWKLTD
ncbi:MAG TPA: hypothetical protein VK395_33610 [Gemmataceae bacterium]|nr:hypothetical protein [Gemmataceae bacterium]